MKNKIRHSFLKVASSLAMVSAFAFISTLCGGILGEEKAPASLLDME